MTKKEIADIVSKKTDITSEAVMAVLNAALETIAENVADGKMVCFRGFGAFKAKTYAKKAGQDITNRKPVIIPARRAPVFKAYPNFKNLVK